MKRPSDITLLPQRIERASIPEPMSGCWLWLAAVRKGYGVISINNKSVGAHRASWIAFKYESPDGMLVCHSCDNRLCVNPDHLFLGTPQSNMDDMKNKGRANAPCGEHQGLARLTEVAVAEILSSSEGGPALAERFGVSKESIYAVRRGETWKHCNPTSNKPEGVSSETSREI